MNRTKGGAGGTTTTVSSLAAFTAAAGADGAYVIVLKGALSGSAKVKVTSNKSIIGASGASRSLIFPGVISSRPILT
jgi:pectate lyase